jgi:methionyl-tRNA synthetase
LIDQAISVDKPWEISDLKELGKIILPHAQNILGLAYQLTPFLPETAQKIEKQFTGPKIKSATALFPRI